MVTQDLLDAISQFNEDFRDEISRIGCSLSAGIKKALKDDPTNRSGLEGLAIGAFVLNSNITEDIKKQAENILPEIYSHGGKDYIVLIEYDSLCELH